MLIKKDRIPIKDIILFGLFPSFIKKMIYRLKGYEIGNKVKIGVGSIILGKNVTIADYATIGFATVIRGKNINIGRFVNIGSFTFIDTENIEIGEDTRIRENVYVTGLKKPESKLKIGNRCLISQYTFINPTLPVIFGDDCSLGGHSKIFTHSSFLSIIEGYPVTFEGVTVGNKVWIPWDVFILPGVNIGDNVVIGSNSHITRDIPSNCIVAGNPARIKVKNFPIPPIQEEVDQIINNILLDFRNHLKHNGYVIEELRKGKVEVLKISKKTNHYLYYNEEIIDNKHEFTDKVILLNDIDIPKQYPKRKTMILSLKKLLRIGSSLIGEELVDFLSRYGIRFQRLD